MNTRPYVTDLARNSVSLQVINDEFRNFADDLSLWSFYETLKTSIGVGSVIIVDKDSATLGAQQFYVSQNFLTAGRI